MPATTRRQAATHSDTGPSNGGSSDIETLLRSAMSGVAKLRRENKHLAVENARLKEALERIEEAQDVSIQPKPVRRRNASVLSLTTQVNKLRRQIANVEEARKKDKRKIRKLQMKEIRRDAMELGDELEHGINDEAAEMKSLLRRFAELMSTPSMEEKEECAVCLTEMTLETARSLPCQHIFCASCLPNIDPPNCPNCRLPFGDVEEAESVQFTATAQWDALLEVANEWMRLDKGESPVGSEQEGKELPFIEDDETNFTVSEETDGDAEEDAVDDRPLIGTPSNNRIRRPSALSTPPPDGDSSQLSQLEPPSTPTRALPSPVSYQSSPVSVKRQRMKELAQARMSKRARW